MTLSYDLVAIGGGTGGLVSAAGAAYLGLRSAIVEKTALGGDCLWTGCVPSKALIASARRAHAVRSAEGLGIAATGGPAPSFQDVMERMRQARATVAHHDDPERFRSMGVDVHFGPARFVDRGSVEVEGVGRIHSKRFVIATGAVPLVPPIPGLDGAGYWTYENVFDQDHQPERLTILGGGPIGLKFAQVFARLGTTVTVVEMADRILVEEDPDVSDYMTDRLRQEGIDVCVDTRADSVGTDDGGQYVETSR